MTEPSRIGFVRAPSGCTVLTGMRVVPPFAVTRGFHLDGALPGRCSVILQSTTGAMAPGDDVRLCLHAGPGAQAHVTTQGATAVHAGGPSDIAASQHVTVTADTGALVELLPEPLVLFAGSALASELVVDVAPGAVVLAREVVAGHDPAGLGGWFATLTASTTIRRSGAVVATERLALVGTDDLAAPGIVGSARVLGSLWAVGAVPVEALLDAWRGVPGLVVARLPNDAGLVARRLGDDGNDVAAALHDAWLAARTILTGAPPAPHRTGSF